MKYFIYVVVIIFQILSSQDLFAQKKFGKLTDKSSFNQLIDISVYHQYELNLKKGTIALLNITNFEVITDLTVVNADGFIVEQAEHFLIFEAPEDGKYDLYINTLEGQLNQGKYTLTTHLIKPENNNPLQRIKKLLQRLEKPDRAGIALAIIEKGNLIFEHYNGFSNAEDKIKLNENTVFELASVSKQFTAMAIAKLAEDGKLSIEDDIRKYFPELPIYKTPIKIKHLVNHTSGLADSDYPLALAGFEYDPIDIDRVLNFLQNAPELYFEPGSEFAYSNDGYTILGDLVHRVTKQTFRDWMKENLFDPLKMNSTIIRDSPEIVIPNRAISYDPNEGQNHFKRQSFDFYAPGGCSVRSSISDLIKWTNYLNEGYHSQKSLFKRINQVETFSDGNAMEYAYGNFVTEFKGLKRISHLGLSAGFRTAIARFPSEDVSFILLGNDGEFRNYYLSLKIYEFYLKDKLTYDYKKFEGIETFSPSKDVDKEKQIEDLKLTEYKGTYFSIKLNTTYTFEVIQDTLFARSAAYKPIPLIATAKDTFQTDEDFMETIIFKRDYNQKVSDCDMYNDDDDRGITFRKIPSTIKWPKSKHWNSSSFQQRMRDSLQKIETSKILTGFAVSIFDETETFMQEGFGFANVENQKAYNPETVQMVASVSKSITGVAVMKAIELGYFKLDDPINEYLPYELTNPKFPEKEITIRHLLTHTSSLDDTDNYDHGYVFSKPLEKENWPKSHHKYLGRYDKNEKRSLSDFLNLIIDPNSVWYNKSQMYTKYSPGTNYEYSNMGFALLGYIIETTSKVDFRDFTKKHIFDPLDMKSATWDLEKVDPLNHITYYLENYNAAPYYSCNTLPEGNLFTNIIDLTKFLQEAIKGYAGRGKILTQASYTEMFRMQSNFIELGDGGLGWDLSIPCCIGHSGNDFGIATVMYFEPRTGIGRIIFSNTSTEIEKIADTFYGIMNLLFLEE